MSHDAVRRPQNPIQYFFSSWVDRTAPKPHVFMRSGYWKFRTDGAEMQWLFKSIRHIQDFARTGRL